MKLRLSLSYASLLCLIQSALSAPSASSAILSVSQSQWAALNRTVQGRLHVGTPSGLSCYARYNNGGKTTLVTPDGSECFSATAFATNATYLVKQFGAYLTYQYGTCTSRNQACPANGVDPVTWVCYQGCVSNYYIEVQTPSDVAAGLAFARKHKINLAVKNTGHDYKGRSSAPDSLALWTHKYQPPISIEKSFVPEGCSDDVGPTITYGAGQGFDGLYAMSHEHGYMLVGGTSPTVGASGGYITGGGHSSLTPTLGLAVDNAAQMKVVLPNGTYITANRCQNQDAFFAMRGGGGSTFGVLMETTSYLHKEVPLQYAQFTIAAPGPDAVAEIAQIFVQNGEKWADDGWGGFAVAGADGIGLLLLVAITPKLTLAQARKSMQPVIDFAESVGNLSIAVSHNVSTLPNYNAYYHEPAASAVGGFAAGDAQVFSSRLIPRSNFQNSPKQLTDVLTTMLHNRTSIPFGIQLVGPAAYTVPESDQPGGPGYSSVTPAWRDTIWHVTFATTWKAGDPTYGGHGSAAAVYKLASESADPLRKITPGSGAYQNEADTYEPDAPSSFWGSNYDRLLKLKQESDPDNVLTCHQCVGWDESDDRFGCYPTL